MMAGTTNVSLPRTTHQGATHCRKLSVVEWESDPTDPLRDSGVSIACISISVVQSWIGRATFLSAAHPGTYVCHTSQEAPHEAEAPQRDGRVTRSSSRTAAASKEAARLYVQEQLEAPMQKLPHHGRMHTNVSRWSPVNGVRPTKEGSLTPLLGCHGVTLPAEFSPHRI